MKHERADDRASEDEVMITRLLEKSIRRTEAVDREALCIVAGEKVSLGWCNPADFRSGTSG